jgi:Ca2+-binding RTX toxin-like protein
MLRIWFTSVPQPSGTGNTLNNYIAGGSGDDLLNGGAGNDWLNGGAGVDTLYGGGGNDVLYGSDGNDVLYGGNGDDVLDGAGGDDTMTGGAGNDVYYVSVAGDTLVESADAGVDTVITFMTTYALGDNVENLTYIGPSAFTGTGNALNNTISGSCGDDILNAGAGSDWLNGGSGIDTLYGGDGDDVLCGNFGNDILYSGTGLDHLYGGAGSDRFVFTSLADAGLSSTRDIIEDFQTGDDIDLSAIDADIVTSGDQAFSYIGADDFAGVSGSLRYADGIVSGDVNGDMVADFEIQIASAPTLTENDFIL